MYYLQSLSDFALFDGQKWPIIQEVEEILVKAIKTMHSGNNNIWYWSC